MAGGGPILSVCLSLKRSACRRARPVGENVDMRHIVQAVIDRLAKGHPLVLATIIDHEGSTPRTAGSRMIVDPDGTICGTIGGGLLEAQVIAQARQLFQCPAVRLIPFDLGGRSPAGDMDMICGGRVTVLVERWLPDNAACQWWQNLEQALREKHRSVVVSELPQGQASACPLRRFRLPGGRLMPDDPAIDGQLAKALASVALSGKAPRIINAGSRRFLLEPIFNSGTVFLFGAGHVSQQVAGMAAAVDFGCVVIDDRPEFANPRRFPAADAIVVADRFDQALTGLPIDEAGYVVIVTRGHRHDATVLSQALRTKAGYIGMIGSRRKRDAIYDHLRAQGFGQADLNRVHSPIGLAIGAETPAEIAVSIVAQLIAVRKKAEGQTPDPLTLNP
jgi:xanthine dehydrogenase accessory factor